MLRVFHKFLLTITSLLVVVLLIYSAVNLYRIKYFDFKKASMRLEKKSKELLNKAISFNQKKLLEHLPMNKLNKYYFRFDEHIRKAEIDTDFNELHDNKEVISLKFSKGDFIATKGEISVLNFSDTYINLDKGTTLKNIIPLNIALDNLGYVLIRLKVAKSGDVIFAWSYYSNVLWWWMHSLYIKPIISDNKFHTYRIDSENICLFNVKDDNNILNTVELSLPGEIGRDVELDYVKFFKKNQKYKEKVCDSSYIRINNELRSGLYINSNTSLGYELSLPDEDIFLSFGISDLLQDDASSFTISIIDDSDIYDIYFKNNINPDAWADEIINLSQWSGKKIKVIFDFSSENQNTLFLSSPMVYIKPKIDFNVIIFLEDSLRADNLSCYGYKRNTSPLKDKFAKDGIIFLNAFAQETRTRQSVASLVTSLYPTATGVCSSTDYLDENYLTLAEVLRSQGFLTVAFIQNQNASSYAGLHQGFDVIFDGSKLKDDTTLLVEDLLSSRLKYMTGRNFFIYLHLLDPHCPYDPPDRFRIFYNNNYNLFSNILLKVSYVDPEWEHRPTWDGRIALYDGEILSNDYWFGEMLQKINEFGLKEDTLIFSIADHGEYLGEHNLIVHSTPGYKQVLHVPFVVVYPKRVSKNIKIRENVQLIDIFPTILDYASIEKKDMLIAGDSLVSLMDGENIKYWRNRAIVSDEVSDKTKDELNTSSHASVFFQKYHFINSKKFKPDSPKFLKVKKSSGKIYPNAPEDSLKFYNGLIQKSNLLFFLPEIFFIRVYDFYEDKDEMNMLKSFHFDFLYRATFLNYISEIQKNNRKIWRILNYKHEEPEYTPDYLESLKSLGYLQ